MQNDNSGWNDLQGYKPFAIIVYSGRARAHFPTMSLPSYKPLMICWHVCLPFTTSYYCLSERADATITIITHVRGIMASYDYCWVRDNQWLPTDTVDM